MTLALHEWHPSKILIPSEHEFRIYGDNNASMWHVVDEIDYHWAIQFLWSTKWSKGKGPNRKRYLRRNVQTLHQPEFREEAEGGKLVRIRTQQTLFLHVSIMRRTGILPPTPEHTI